MPKILKPDKAIKALENFSIWPYQAARPVLCVVKKADAGPSCDAYLRGISRCAEKYGAKVEVDEVASFMDAVTSMSRIRREPAYSGVLVLGSFGELEDASLKGMIPPRVDIDCVNHATYGRFAASSNPVGYREGPCTAIACYKMLEYGGFKVEGSSVGIIGRSLTVGRPLAEILISKGATVTVYNSHSDLSTLSLHDAVVAAVGKPRMVTGDMLSSGQWVVDVGINVGEDGKLCGDVDYESACAVVGDEGAVTPVPGGIGPLTNAVLFSKLFRNAYLEMNGGIA